MRMTDEQIRREYFEMRIRAQAVIGNGTEDVAARDVARYILDGEEED